MIFYNKKQVKLYSQRERTKFAWWPKKYYINGFIFYFWLEFYTEYQTLFPKNLYTKNIKTYWKTTHIEPHNKPVITEKQHIKYKN